MTLEEMLERAIPSDRLIVCEEDGTELYRGYVACVGYGRIDTGREVKRYGLETNIFRRENRGSQLRRETYSGQRKEISPEGISDFGFSDLEMLIYTRVTLENVRQRN